MMHILMTYNTNDLVHLFIVDLRFPSDWDVQMPRVVKRPRRNVDFPMPIRDQGRIQFSMSVMCFIVSVPYFSKYIMFSCLLSKYQLITFVSFDLKRHGIL